MMGLFTELGPCSLTADNLNTLPNVYSWNKNASIIFLEQPAGTGFSTLLDGTAYPSTRDEGATDFQTFLNMFFRNIFPDLADLPLHIAGESFGGIYVPSYTNHILQSRKRNQEESFTGNISSIILVNAAIETVALHEGEYELLCNQSAPVFNSSTCSSMLDLLPECQDASQRCRDTYDNDICADSYLICESGIGRFYDAERLAGLKSPYNSKYHSIYVDLELMY